MKRVLLLLLLSMVVMYAQAAHSIAISITPGTGNTGDAPTQYNVKRAAVTGGPYTQIATVLATASPLVYVDNTVLAGNTYFYVVTAANSGGETASSNQLTCVVNFQAPTAPPTVSATVKLAK